MARGRMAVVMGLLLLAGAVPSGALAGGDPTVSILAVEMVNGHVLEVDVATAGADSSQAETPTTATLTVWLGAMPVRAALPLFHMPSRFAWVVDLPAGVVRVGGVAIGTFSPILPFRDNTRFAVEVTLERGPHLATDRQTGTVLLPTVIVPGLLNMLGQPNAAVLDGFKRFGYKDVGPAQTLFWFAYPASGRTLQEDATDLATYVRRVVLPKAYAARINVVGFSSGGLLPRWNVAYDVDGWGTLVNRLALVGVPNEGAVFAYLAAHSPLYRPFAAWGRSPLATAHLPTFPFWRARSGEPWAAPPNGENPTLAQLNSRPIPDGVRVYLYYGKLDRGRHRTVMGLTGAPVGGAATYGAGDGVVLVASVLGQSINGAGEITGLTRRVVLRVNVGSVLHVFLFPKAASLVAPAMQDTFQTSLVFARTAKAAQVGVVLRADTDISERNLFGPPEAAAKHQTRHRSSVHFDTPGCADGLCQRLLTDQRHDGRGSSLFAVLRRQTDPAPGPVVPPRPSNHWAVLSRSCNQLMDHLDCQPQGEQDGPPTHKLRCETVRVGPHDLWVAGKEKKDNE